MRYTVRFSGAFIVDAPNQKAALDELELMTGDDFNELLLSGTVTALPTVPDDKGYKQVRGSFATTHFRIPSSSGPFCGVCGGVPPDNHFQDCPVLTGEPVPGAGLWTDPHPYDEDGSRYCAICGCPRSHANHLTETKL